MPMLGQTRSGAQVAVVGGVCRENIPAATGRPPQLALYTRVMGGFPLAALPCELIRGLMAAVMLGSALATDHGVPTYFAGRVGI